MKRAPSSNRREYIRLDSVFPVQFRIVSLDGKEYHTDWVQGFTHNVSQGGLQLDVNNCDPRHIDLLKSGSTGLFLQIQMPLSRPAINAQAKVAWVSDAPDDQNRTCIGLTFETISEVGQRHIMRVVRAKRLFLPGVLTLLFLLGLGFAVNGYVSIQLVKGNKALVQQLIKILQESIVAKQKIDQISSEKQDLQRKLGALEVRIQTVEDEKAQFAQKAEVDQIKSAGSLKELNRIIEQLTQEKAALQEQLIGLQHKENAVTEELLKIDQKKATLEKASFDAMYRWLAGRQNPRTGLVTDHVLDRQAKDRVLVYDQALAVLAYVHFRDFERAKALLDFFSRKARRIDGFFLSAYSAEDASPVENTVNSGGTIWVGIAALHYTHTSGDRRYLGLAEDIASVILDAQQKNIDRAIPVRPGEAVYASRENLDGYSFFSMLYQLTHKEAYREARDAIMVWLRGHIEPQTYAWSIIALGPAALGESGVNPDQALESSEEHFGVKAQLVQADGQSVAVQGFDFRSSGEAGRSGPVPAEPTAQMIIAYRSMADHYHKQGMSSKARSYDEKADTLMHHLCSMIVSRVTPAGQSEGWLPSSSADFTDTGSGKVIARGSVAGSVAATASALFAYYKYNPLRLVE